MSDGTFSDVAATKLFAVPICDSKDSKQKQVTWIRYIDDIAICVMSVEGVANAMISKSDTEIVCTAGLVCQGASVKHRKKGITKNVGRGS